MCFALPSELVSKKASRIAEQTWTLSQFCWLERIVKSRVLALAKLRGKSETEALEIAERFSGHSMRAGYATSAARADISHAAK